LETLTSWPLPSFKGPIWTGDRITDQLPSRSDLALYHAKVQSPPSADERRNAPLKRVLASA